MKEKLKALWLGLSATMIAMVPSLLPSTSATCTGICSSCGGCAGVILGVGAGGLIFFTKLFSRKKEKEN